MRLISYSITNEQEQESSEIAQALNWLNELNFCLFV